MGSTDRVEPARDSRAGHLPVQSAATRRPRRRAGRPGLPPDADQDVSAVGEVRRRVRSSRGFFARVSTGDVSAKPARVGRRLPRRSGLDTWSGGYYQNDKPPDGGFLVALKDTKG